MILINIAIAILIGLAIEYVTDGLVSQQYSILIGVAVWAIVLFKVGVADSFFVHIPYQHGAVFVNPLFAEKTPATPEDAIDLTTPPQSVRQAMWGDCGKWPWEQVYVADLTRHTVLKVGVEVYTKNGITLIAEWTATLSILSTHIYNARRWSPEAQAQYFTGEFVENLRETVVQLTENEVLNGAEASANVQRIKDRFSKTFGGENVVHPDERKRGMYTNKPQLLSIQMPADYRKALAAAITAEKLAAGVEVLKAKIGDPKIAAAMMAGVQGITNVQVWDITGLENLRTAVVPNLNTLKTT